MKRPDPSAPLQSPLDEYGRQYEVALGDLRALVEPLRQDQVDWRPGPGRWSIGECVQHLHLGHSPYLPLLERAIADGWERGWVGGGARYGFIDRWFIRNLEASPKRRLKAPKEIQPAANRPKDELLAAVSGDIAILTSLLGQANGLDLGRVRVRSPLLRLLNFRLGAVFAFLAAHYRRHLWQARQVQAAPGYPG